METQQEYGSVRIKYSMQHIETTLADSSMQDHVDCAMKQGTLVANSMESEQRTSSNWSYGNYSLQY